MATKKKKGILFWLLLSLTPAVLLFLFLQFSAQGFEAFEQARYLLILIIPLILYIAFRDTFK